MSSNSEENDSTKACTVHTEAAVQDDASVGAKVGQGITGALKLVHGIGESIRGLAIDIADLGKGSGKTIMADGKAETKEGIKQMGNSVHR